MSTISASTTTTTAYKVTADTTGTLVLQTGSSPTTAATFDASQNVGVGVVPNSWYTGYTAFNIGYSGALWSNRTSADTNVTVLGNNAYLNSGATNWIFQNNGYATRYSQSAGTHVWYSSTASGTAGNAITFTQAMTLDASGNWKLGTTDTGGRALVSRATVPTTYSKNTAYLQLGAAEETTNGYHLITFGYTASGNTYQPAFIGYTETNSSGNSAGDLIFGTRSATTDTAPTERARISSSGYVLVNQTSDSLNTYVQATSSLAGVGGYGYANTNASPTSNSFYSNIGSGSSTSCLHFYGRASGADKVYIYGNGNIVNANNSYGSLSDIKLKENITDATPKLAQLNQVRVVNYNLKSDPEHKQLGVIAQELEQIFPGMVEESPDYEEVTTTDEEGNEITERVATGTTTKQVKYSVFVPMLIKAIQEQQAIIETLTNRITALEAK